MTSDDFQGNSDGDLKQRASPTSDLPDPVKGAIAAVIEREREKERIEYEKAEKDRMEQTHRLNCLQIAFTTIFNCTILLGSKYFKDAFFKKFYILQYRYPGTDLYDRGIDDSYFIATVIVNLMAVRAISMEYVFGPIARTSGIQRYKAIQRFQEQSWSLLYYACSWIFGFYLYWNSEYFLSAEKLFEGWPHNHMSFAFKLYYLIQTGCWLQQIVVLNIEEKRKDYLQMFSHHIITSLLCIGSYISYFTRIGHNILLLMDIVDVILSLAKILKYSGFGRICDIIFICFMLLWIVLRHGIYNYLVWVVATKATKIMDRDCSKFPSGSNEICYTQSQINFFIFLLIGLQIITIIWLLMILRVAFRVITGGSAEDVRSDSEGADDDKSKAKKEK